ncbi:MAG: stage II sporulation protein M [Planctomycetes bacterium]|nr:stage II sporulation protein M [Planctomycetota bacterium]
MLELLKFVFINHSRLALHSALLFGVGLFAAVPVVRYKLSAVGWLPRRIFEIVLRFMGRRPVFWRVAGVIWLYNSAVMLLFLASGFHPLLPKLFAVWTGLNVGIVGVETSKNNGWMAGRMTEISETGWQPPASLAPVCGLLVFVLELPCFWYTLAMGIRLGHMVQKGESYARLFGERAEAYFALIFPLLLVSAILETIAIRGGPPSPAGAQ